MSNNGMASIKKIDNELISNYTNKIIVFQLKTEIF